MRRLLSDGERQHDRCSNSREDKEENKANPKLPLTTLSQFSLAQLEHAAEALQEWTEQNAEEARAHVKDQTIDAKLRQSMKLLHNERVAGMRQQHITEMFKQIIRVSLS